MSENLPDEQVRPGESSAQRYDRNWEEILQELRVTQTGTQILTGFLLALAFQQRFREVDRYELVVYLVLVGLACVATALALAPVSLHRWLFQRKAKRQVVLIGNRILRANLIAVALLVVGVVLFVFDFVVGFWAGFVAGVVAALVVAALWVLLPFDVRRHGPAEVD
ncbi:DUF6328 family protein [Gryllotalpicola ginsengisoli]|uniref:DUF6328 family protein n=1 Tax=Gryllotalpicola ginsengisoli TaxID=444608 RepID=UPI0003B466F8|nr:DUF6328 family protein [Gryllotalpicola ginsengisoli]